MPDVGTPLPSVPPSHTSSDQWQSFEIRMRHRRAERLVARAEAALDAGHDNEARDALAEARALHPESLDFETLKARLDARHAATAAAHRAKKRNLSIAVGGAAALLIVGAFALIGGDPAENPQTVAARSSDVSAAPPANAPVATSSAGASEGVDTQRIVSTEGTVSPAERILETPASREPQADRSVPRDEKAAAPSPRTDGSTTGLPPTPSTLSRSSPSEPALPSVRDVDPQVKISQPTTTDAMNSRALPPPTMVDPAAAGLPSAAPPQPISPPPAPSEPTEERAEIGDEQKVRGVLEQFEAAYSSLNAAAARAVWPSVDEPSLARAFASLESQRVSLGACSIRVTGAAARADCTGTTSWRPKIGGAGKTEPRRWSFDLQSANGAWRIVRAEAR